MSKKFRKWLQWATEISNVIGDAIIASTGYIGEVWDDWKKNRSREFARLAKNDPSIRLAMLNPETKGKDERKIKGRDRFHRYAPKMKENKYMSRNIKQEKMQDE